MTQKSKKKTLLLTGFGPFPSVPENASGQLVSRLTEEARQRFPNVNFISKILPTEWTVGNEQLVQVMHQHTPDICLHFGVSERATGFVIEQRAYNACDMAEDVSGKLPPLKTLTETGPEFRNSTFPASRLASRLKCCGLPTELSTDPGRYLCNAVLFHSLTFDADKNLPACTGFIHIPTTFAPISDPEGLSLDRAIAGGLEIIATCLMTQPATNQG